MAMKLVHFDDLRLGILAGDHDDRVVDVSDVAGEAGPGLAAAQARLESLIANWTTLAPALRQAAGSRDGAPLGSVRLRAPVPRPGQLVCAAVNYLEQGRPEPAPFNAFLKAPTSIVGNGDTVELPPAEVTWFHFEPELALVIGKRAAHLAPEAAMEHVFGYTSFVDVSARGLPADSFSARAGTRSRRWGRRWSRPTKSRSRTNCASSWR
jgi:2-keto-4-pentenoate hydratase/2-oxohepta-3-ene-1,7-dioic acid hydratase in catechol pathway